ncbi:GNAT family N-acetyltransferase [Ruminococcus sp.]|uniref:GNAT family N-acetyltransferase n=1 Tax=Ruminococcus sp. TaxID=41978 RepID=UPI0026330A72|nr:GNAT family N-acetyltransferase [Ruminococcus sp.]MDD7556381.1 GNAT family N-acetyltransferase [Ruminococcus sp.]
MGGEYINLSSGNLIQEHLCCIIREKKPHPGVEAKRRWLAARLPEGHMFRKLNAKGCAFIEYAPLERAWVPVMGENYLYIYCLWVDGALKKHGYGQELMEYCIFDARSKAKSGICMLGADKQKAWLSDQSFAQRFGFQPVDRTEDGYQLLALSFDGTEPRFAPRVRHPELPDQQLTIYYDMQCPFILDRVDKLRAYCTEHAIPAAFVLVDTLAKAKSVPGVFNNWAVFYHGKQQTVNQLSPAMLEKLISRCDG